MTEVGKVSAIKYVRKQNLRSIKEGVRYVLDSLSCHPNVEAGEALVKLHQLDI